MPTHRPDLTGRVFGMLRVIEFAEQRAGQGSYWRCECSCGRTDYLARATRLLTGYTLHCGCAGYRVNSEWHKTARKKVPAAKRKAIARMGAAAANG